MPIFYRQTESKRRSLPKRLPGCLLALCLLFANAAYAAKNSNFIEKIELQADPLQVAIHLPGEVPFKVIQVGSREVLIALRNLSFSGKVPQKGTAGPFLEKLSLARLPHNVVGITLNTAGPVKNIRTRWLKQNRVLAVALIGPEKTGTAPAAASSQAAPKRAAPPVSTAVETPPAPAAPKKKTTPQTEASPDRYDPGTLDAILDDVETAACTDGADLQKGLRLCRKERFREAEGLLGQYLATLPPDAPRAWDDCVEAAFFLRAYCFLKNRQGGNAIDQLEAAQLFQEAMNLFPESRFLPYALTALGNTAMVLNNFEEARGYFKLVLNRYPDYRGTPEALLGLGRVYVQKKKHSTAVAAFRKIIDLYPRSQAVPAAKLALGRTLYETNHLSEAISVLNAIRTDTPRRAYESSDLLICLGNAYYQTGQLEKARQTLAAAFNAFPEDEQNHILLTRIGDIYRDLGQTAQAQPFYRLVRELYPGTDGYLISSLREAEAIEDAVEKEKIYQMIIAEYPDNPLSNLALVSLAEQYSRTGEDEKSIATIRSFFEKYPKELNQEAAFIFQEAYRRIFSRLAAADDYPGILARFEADRAILKKIENPELFYAAGKAYLQARLYHQAAATLKIAHDLYLPSRRPSELAFEVGAALQAAGKPAKALPFLEEFLRKSPEAPHAAEASYRCGQILAADKAYGEALARFQTALARGKAEHAKGLALMGMAEAYRGLNRLEDAGRSLVKAINHLAAAAGSDYDGLFAAYRRLGAVFLELKTYDKAADALSMALKFTDQPQKYPDLSFLLGETYLKSAAPEQARLAFQEVVAAGDPFWARLAEEALRRLAIAGKLPRDA